MVKAMKLAPIFNPDARRPMPRPVRVDLRRVFLAGLALWGIALIVCLVLMAAGVNIHHALGVVVSGIIVGMVMLVWEHFDRDNYRRLGE